MIKAVLSFFTLLLVATTFAQSSDEQAVRNVLTEQVKQWNRGNIPAFMETYRKSDSLLFIGKKGVTYGWQQTMDNYKKGYPDTASMGKLQFDLLLLKSLSPTNYFVVGKWHLTRTIGDLGGIFSLVLEKVAGKWLIIADHTQSD